MKYLEFKNALKEFPVFSYQDIRKFNPDFQRNRLYEWQLKGLIKKIRKAHYYFSDQNLNEAFFNFVANRIYRPSYISLESAFSYYNLIPEAVFSFTSVSTKKTFSLDTIIGNYEYQNIKPSLFFGYRLVKMKEFNIKIAEPEKAILDYIYLRKPNDITTFEMLRLNLEVLSTLITLSKLDAYLKVYSSNVMNKRVQLFKKYINAES